MNDLLWFVLAWLISIPTGIIINLFTPSIETYLKKGYLSVKERQKYLLVNHYKQVKSFQNHPVFSFHIPDYVKLTFFPLAILTIFSLTQRFYEAELGDFYNLFRKFVIFSTFPFSIYANIRTTKDLFLFREWKNFYEYRKGVIKKLVKLGGNPAELDKIDRELEQIQ